MTRPLDARVDVDAGVKPQVDVSSLDLLLDIDQKREQKPGGSWTDQQYVGPKQYDKLFVDIKHDTPMAINEHPSGPLGTVDRVELVGGGRVLATIPTAELHYGAEMYSEFANDRGTETGTREHMKIFLGPVVGEYVKSTHPYKVVLRGLTKANVLVIEATFDGDEGGDYPSIVPPRPY